MLNLVGLQAWRRRARTIGRLAAATGAVVAWTACGDFDAGAAGGETDDNESGVADTEYDTAPPTTASSTTGTTTTDTDTSTPVDTETGDSGSAVPCDLDCGDDAFCDAPAGEQQCVCFDGSQQWAGTACIECFPAAGSNVAVDIPVVDAVFRVSLDGAQFPQSPTEGGRLFLRSRDTLDEVDLGPTSTGEYMATVIAGTYDAFYEYVRGGAQVPLNRSAWLGVLQVDDAEPIELDVKRTLVEVSTTINGAASPQSPTNFGRILLVDPATSDEVALTQTSTPLRRVYVVPGIYDVHYRWANGVNSVPANRDAILGKLEVPAQAETYALLLDIPYVEVSGEILVNGAPAPASPNEFGDLTLVGSSNPDDRTPLGPTSSGQYSVKLIPDAYQVYYSHRAGGSTVPVNTWGWVREFIPEAGGDIDIPSVVASGNITIGGQPPPSDDSNDGTLRLRTSEGDDIILGNTRDGQFSRRVIPGTYDVYYSQETAGGLVPVNTNARLTQQIFEAGATGDIDIGLLQLTGTISLGGQLPPTSEYDDGRVYLRNRETGDSVLLGNTRLGTFSQPVVPDVYDLVYVVESAGAGVPVNTEAVIREDVDVNLESDLAVDIAVGRLQGSILLDGADPMATGATIVLQDVRTGDEVFLGTLDDPAFDQVVATGRYLARYLRSSEAYQAPENRNAAFQCIDVIAP